MSEQGRKHDGGKLRYDLLPVLALKDVVKGLTYGTIKYDDNNWINVPEGRKRYIAAAMRHIEKYRMGVLFDEESGVHHLSAAIDNLMFIVEKDLRGWEDIPEETKDISQEELKEYTKNLLQEQVSNPAVRDYPKTVDVSLVNDVIQVTPELWYPPVKEGENAWIEYDGSGQPVNNEVIVEVMHRYERENKEWYSCDEPARGWWWEWYNHPSVDDVVAYRVV